MEKASAWTPELVLMDLRMPRLGGLDATRELKRDRPELKVVAVTANAFEEDRAAALAAGCDDFVRKPFLAADILKCLNQHLGLQRGRTSTCYEAILHDYSSACSGDSTAIVTHPFGTPPPQSAPEGSARPPTPRRRGRARRSCWPTTSPPTANSS